MADYITIPAAHFPSGNYEVILREPLFKDRREANRRHPGEESRVGYTLQELLCAMCLHSVNGQEFDDSVMDIMERLRGIPHLDGQFLIAVFVSTFTMDAELIQQAKEVADGFIQSGQMVCTIPEKVLPSHKHTVSFQRPSLGGRMDLERIYPGEDSNCGYTFEELFFSSSLVSIDGEPVPGRRTANALIETLDNWTHLDAQFAMSVFVRSVSIDRERMQTASQLGKDYRAGFSNPKDSAPTPDITPTSSKSSRKTSQRTLASLDQSAPNSSEQTPG
jgi:hypothetical protein